MTENPIIPTEKAIALIVNGFSKEVLNKLHLIDGIDHYIEEKLFNLLNLICKTNIRANNLTMANMGIIQDFDFVGINKFIRRIIYNKNIKTIDVSFGIKIWFKSDKKTCFFWFLNFLRLNTNWFTLGF